MFNPIWNIENLIETINNLAEKYNISQNIIARLFILLHRLYRLNEHFYLPQPQIDYNNEYTVEFSWFDRQENKVLSFTLDDYAILVIILDRNHSTEFNNPNDNEVIRLFKWMHKN